MAGRILVRDLIALDGNADPYAGAKLYTYRTGTTVDQATYTTEDLNVAHANPVVADAGGKFADIWADLNMAYRIYVTNADGSVILNDTDPVYAQGQATNAPPRSITTTTTLTGDDLNKTLRYSGTFTVTRPLGSTLTAGFKWRHVNDGTGVITLATSGADTAEVSTLNPFDVYDEEWDGTSWKSEYIGGGQGKHQIAVLANAMTPQTTNGATFTVSELSTNKQMVPVHDFSASTQQYVQFRLPMPKSVDESTITYRVRWKHAATTVNFGVAWSLEAIAYSNDDALDASWGTAVTVTDTGGTTSDYYITDESAAVTPAGTWAEGDTVWFRLSRVVADAADTLNALAGVIAVDVFVTTNAPNDY